jgi:DNA-binding CsgD family transcriptional regulator
MSGQPPVAQSPSSPRATLDLSRLSPREADIVLRLLAGDRVPRIADSLYLAPSTVRNHLSSVFRKLGVNSQQQLILLLRARQRAEFRPASCRSPRVDLDGQHASI